MAVLDSAKAIVRDFLDSVGLGSLVNWAWNTYIQAGGGTTGMDAITAELPNTDQFKARFPAYEQLRKEGRAMSINEMLSYEQTARQIFQSAGLPQGFYDSPKELAQFMLHDVSTSELQQRVQDEQTAVINSPPDVRAQLHGLFGVDAGHLTAYFLDPTKAEPIIHKQVTAAQIAAEGTRTQFGQLNRAQAMHLASLGVTDQQAQQGFTQLGLERGLFQAQVQGEKAIGVNEQLGAQFAGDSLAQLAFKRRQAERLAQFQQQSGFTQTNAGVGGLAPAERGGAL
jgi:hypothetical protein